jgi:hypothetical protein
MIILTDTQNNIEYRISLVPMADAFKLLEQGQVFYDFTKITAAYTCPTWGVLRYGKHLSDLPLSTGGRSLAIECGSACHDFFAAVRLWTLLERYSNGTSEHALVNAHAIKLLGKDRWESMLSIPQDSDRVNNCQLFALDALHTSGYYDDPSDRKRTLSNMETACISYADRYLAADLPVLVRGNLIGIEIPFVLKVERIATINKAQLTEWRALTTAYYCGRIDGIHDYGGSAMVGENKTAASLSSAWRTSFAISHQITGYTIAGTCLLREEVSNAQVMGVQIPLPRDAFNGIVFHPETRTESDRLRWAEWFFGGIETYEGYMDRPTEAPRYSHSCNRYFSACQFIPFCSLTREEQTDALTSMRHDEWSPLDHLKKKAVEE